MGVTSSLADDEEIQLDLHPHWHQILLPIVLLPVTVGVGTYLFFIAPQGNLRAPIRYLVLAVAVVILVWWVMRPLSSWLATRYVVTNRRIMLRDGVIRRHGRDIPLSRINDVSFNSSLMERMLRCGTLTIESAGEHGQIALCDVPTVERVQHTIYELAEAESQRQLYRPQP